MSIVPASYQFFPRATTLGHGTLPPLGRHPTRPIPSWPAITGGFWPLPPSTPPREYLSGSNAGQSPSLQKLRTHRLSHAPLRVVDLCSGLATGLEAFLRASYTIRRYAWVDTNQDAHIAASQRVMLLKHRFPHLLKQEATQTWDSCLPRDIRVISPATLGAVFPDGVDLILASPPAPCTRVSLTHSARIPHDADTDHDILRLVLHLFASQSDGVGFIWTSPELHPASADTMSRLGPGSILDATKCGSGAYRNTRIWQNLLHHDTLSTIHARLQHTPRPVESALESAGLF